jgi:hypothetical protein
VRSTDQEILEELRKVSIQVQECVSSNQLQTVKLEELRIVQERHDTTIAQMMQTFSQAKGILWFIKACAAVAGGIWATVTAIKEVLSWKIGG